MTPRDGQLYGEVACFVHYGQVYRLDPGLRLGLICFFHVKETQYDFNVPAQTSIVKWCVASSVFGVHLIFIQVQNPVDKLGFVLKNRVVKKVVTGRFVLLRDWKKLFFVDDLEEIHVF